MYYFYQWPSNSIFKAAVETIIAGVAQKAVNITFSQSKERAISSGKILATIIKCRNIFNAKYINLIGFSLGCQVIYSCLQQLKEYECYDLINNVTFLGGAVQIDNDVKNGQLLNKVINGRIVNCYSKEDYILKYVFQLSEEQKPIGMDELKWKEIKGQNNLYCPKIENIDLTDLKMGHLDYRNEMKEIVKRTNLY